MRLTKIYTKVGDKGTTLLATGNKIPKDDERIEAYGTVDELNSVLGLWHDECVSGHEAVAAKIQQVQNELFDLGSELSMPGMDPEKWKLQWVQQQHVERLEQEIDDWNTTIPPLENFILPGGGRLNSLGHLCRTVCRRAERRILALKRREEVRSEVVVYLNRLSDWCFVLSRKLSADAGLKEVLWQQKKPAG